VPGNQGVAGRHDTLRAFPDSIQRMPIVLTSAQNRFLRGQAHGLKAMLQVGGKGVTDAVVAEVAAALEHHELIKVKIAATDHEARDAIIDALVERCEAALVQRIGHVAILYRPSEEQRRIVLPRGAGHRD
jgi:RNA-binding protein